MNKSEIKALMIKETFRKKNPADSKLTRLGRKYALLMGYKSVGLGKWENLSGRKVTSREIGCQLPSLNFLNRKGTDINVEAVKRVNKACVLNQRQLPIVNL